jgi:tetratricopeptide (TPR) repeat protein
MKPNNRLKAKWVSDLFNNPHLNPLPKKGRGNNCKIRKPLYGNHIIGRNLVRVFICFAFTSGASAIDLNVGLATADALERSGNKAGALDMYEAMYREYPNNPALFARFRAFCFSQGMNGRALILIEDQKRLRPDDPSLDTDRGAVLYRMGRKDEAFAAWQALIDRRPDQPVYYHLAAAAMIREKLDQEAISVYERGEKRVKNPGVFNAQLADLYCAVGDYDRAADRILSGYLTRPDIRVLQDFFRRYPKTEPALRGLARRIEQLKAPADRRIDPAFRTARQIIELSRPQGLDALLFFGQSTLDLQAWDWAEKSFQETLAVKPDRESEAKALWGLAQVKEGRGDSNGALAEYKRFVQTHSTGEPAYRAGMRIGAILRGLGRTDEAVRAFESTASAFPSQQMKAWIELGACRVDRGEWDSAGAVFKKVLDESRLGQPDWIRALRSAAEADYFAGRFKETLDLLKQLETLKSDSTALALPELNDALGLRLRVEDRSDHPESLQVLAKGEWLLRVRRFDEAQALLDGLARTDPDMEPAAFLLQADAWIGLGKPDAAVELLDRVWKNHPGSLEAEAALERSGELLQGRGKSKEALDRYETLLAKYPQSQRLGRVRERVRELEEKAG